MEAGEVEEKTNTKEDNKYSVAGGTKESLAFPTEKLSDTYEAPWEDTIKDWKGNSTPVNAN